MKAGGLVGGTGGGQIGKNPQPGVGTFFLQIPIPSSDRQAPGSPSSTTTTQRHTLLLETEIQARGRLWGRLGPRPAAGRGRVQPPRRGLDERSEVRGRRSRRAPQRVTRCPRDPRATSASPRCAVSPGQPSPSPLLRFAAGLASSRLGLSTSLLPDCSVGTRAIRVTSPKCTQSPQRGHGASTPRYPQLQERKRSALGHRVCPAEQPRWGEASGRRCDPAHASTPAPSRALCPRETLTSNKRALPPAGGGQRAENTHAGPSRAGTSLGTTRGLAPGSGAPACSPAPAPAPPPRKGGLYRPAADMQPPRATLPRPRPRPSAPPRPAGLLFPWPLPPLLNARRVQSVLSGRRTRSDVETLPPKWAVISFWWL